MTNISPPPPWTVGQRVRVEFGNITETKVVESIEVPAEGETTYTLVSAKVWELRAAGVRPFTELG